MLALGLNSGLGKSLGEVVKHRMVQGALKRTNRSEQNGFAGFLLIFFKKVIHRTHSQRRTEYI